MTNKNMLTAEDAVKAWAVSRLRGITIEDIDSVEFYNDPGFCGCSDPQGMGSVDEDSVHVAIVAFNNGRRRTKIEVSDMGEVINQCMKLWA